MCEGVSDIACTERSSSDPYTITSYASILFIFDYHISVYLHEIAGSRINIHDNGPVSINSNVLSS